MKMAGEGNGSAHRRIPVDPSPSSVISSYPGIFLACRLYSLAICVMQNSAFPSEFIDTLLASSLFALALKDSLTFEVYIDFRIGFGNDR